MDKNKPKGIGGWMILPIIGLFITVISSVIGLLDTLLYYELASAYYYIFVDSLFLTTSALTLFFIFKKDKLGKKIAVIHYGLALFFALFLFYVPSIVGALIWLSYFSLSKRVKNTLVN